MYQISQIFIRDEKTLEQLLSVWESSVRSTHTFLSDSDIVALRPDVSKAFSLVESLYGAYDKNYSLQGFLGIAKEHIEMLFVDAGARGQGIGKKLLNYAVDNFSAKYVDVNEQNQQGVGFYIHMGFHQIGRSDIDEQGRPFPILHMKRG